jgi:SAM-dependent methyltransferase
MQCGASGESGGRANPRMTTMRASLLALLVLLSALAVAARLVRSAEPAPAAGAPTNPADSPPKAAAPADDAPEKEPPPEPEELPPALTHYLGREIAQTMHYLGAPWLVRESREREEECSTLLEVLDVQPGQVVCDMGCGNGFYALKLAEQVGPEGRILAVDIQPEMLTLLRERCEEAQVENVELILGTLIDPHLPAGEVDLILCVDVYHEFSHPVHMLRALRAALKPEGRVALVEFRAEDPGVPIKPLHKMSKEQINKEWPANGFRLVEEFDELPWQHVMFFARDEEWTAPDGAE